MNCLLWISFPLPWINYGYFFLFGEEKKQNNYKRFKDKKAELFFFLVRDIKLKVYICNVVCLFSSKNATNQKDGGKTGGRYD